MKLADIFSSGMVFAANEPIRIFGFGEGKALVKFAEVEKVIESNGGFWCVELPAMEYGGPYALSFSSAEGDMLLDDIYVGEVYLFSGQSNMAHRLSGTNTDPALYEDNDSLRHLLVLESPEPIGWKVAKRDEVGEWSAIGYLTARAIAKKKNIRVGIIQAATGASVIESWVPKGSFAEIGINLLPEEKHKDHFSAEYAVWNHDAYLYEKKLKRIIPFSITGAVWYQGESDASEAEGRVYCAELLALMKIWRRDFGSERLPFAIIQIADCEERIALGNGWRLVQEAQAKIPEMDSRAYTVISADICETDDIHPPSKYKLAERVSESIINNF